MRTKREFSWQYLLFIIPAVVAVLGIQYLSRKSHKSHNPVALAKNEVKKPGSSPQPQDVRDSNDADETTATPEDATTTEEPKANLVHSHHHEATLAQSSAPAPTSAYAVAVAPTAVDSSCKSTEISGEGSRVSVTSEDWLAVVRVFHHVKEDLLNYLAKNKTHLPTRTYALMEAQVKSLKIQRPPIDEQPDLNWRGIGVFSQVGSPVIQVGTGFVKLIKEDPRRGKFELARLAAQSWAPCEIKKTESSEPWKEMLTCLGIEDADGCTVGAYSEAGWAVSSAIAQIIAPPGCVVPAFAATQTARCLAMPPQSVESASRTVAGQATKGEKAERNDDVKPLSQSIDQSHPAPAKASTGKVEDHK